MRHCLICICSGALAGVPTGYLLGRVYLFDNASKPIARHLQEAKPFIAVASAVMAVTAICTLLTLDQWNGFKIIAASFWLSFFCGGWLAHRHSGKPVDDLN